VAKPSLAEKAGLSAWNCYFFDWYRIFAGRIKAWAKLFAFSSSVLPGTSSLILFCISALFGW